MSKQSEIARAWKEYYEARDRDWIAYNEAIAPASEVFHKALVLPLKAYLKVRAGAEKALDEALASIRDAD